MLAILVFPNRLFQLDVSISKFWKSPAICLLVSYYERKLCNLSKYRLCTLDLAKKYYTKSHVFFVYFDSSHAYVSLG